MVFSIYFLGKIFIENIDVLYDIPLSFKSFFILVISLILYIVVYLIFSFAWLLQLKEKYPFFSFKYSVFIVGRSQIGKYLPGNVGHFVGRLVLLPKNISKTDVTYTMFIENIVMLFTSSIIGLFYIFYFDFFRAIGREKLALILVIVFVFSSISYFGLKLLRQKKDFLEIRKNILAKIGTLSFLSLFIGGVNIYLLFILFGDSFSVTYVQCVTGFALSFIVGFITPGAPGGLGIREFTFVMLFGSFVTEAIALEIILTFRIVSVVGDLSLFGLTKLIKIE